jgi:hypothetical protein
MDWQCPQHPNNWKFSGKQRELTTRQSGKEQGTTRVSQEIIAKQNANNDTGELDYSQHATTPASTALQRPPKPTQPAKTAPKTTQSKRQASITIYTASQQLNQELTPDTLRMNERKIIIIDADSNSPFNE